MSEIKRVSYEEAQLIMNNGSREYDTDLFLAESDGEFIAIDDSAGEHYTESFQTEEIAIDWLNGEFEIENLDLYLAGKANLANLRRRLVELDARKPEISAYYDELKEVKQQLVELQGFDSYFQAESGEVFKLFKPTNKIVFFDEVEYKRTPKEGEPSQNKLSKKEAKEQGFEVK